jgi:RHS repeat-associated protein
MGNPTEYGYDGQDRLITTTRYLDGAPVATVNHYDALGNRVGQIENDTGGASTHDSNVLTQYVYDVLGNRIVITNALGYTSAQTTYDVLGRPVVVEDALGHQTRTQYNALGYRTVVTDANDAVTHYSYDGLNRLSGVHYVSDDVTVTYRYDAASNRTTMTDTLGTTLYVYDDLGRLVSVSDPLTGTVEYGYDLVGNRTQLFYPDGQVVTYTYDADNRLVQVEDWSGGLTGYEYDVAGHLITTTLPNGVTTTRQYDEVNQLTRLTHTANGDTLADFQYKLDGVSNRVQTVEMTTEPGTGITTTITITYDYDPLHRLLATDHSSGERFQYAYDAVGNRTVMTDSMGAYVSTYDAANRLTNVDGVTYTWDSQGNLSSDGVFTYTYDAANRLIEAVQGTNIYTFAYNGQGDRLRQTINGMETNYTLDLNAGLVQVLTDGTNTYLYGMKRIGEQRSGEWQYYLADSLGSVRQMTDGAGEVTLLRSYAPYGSTLTSTGTSSSVFGFTGEWADATNLVYLRSRYLDTATGRFITQDIWAGDPNRPMSYNAWLYGYANPVKWVDHTGLSPRVACENIPGYLDLIFNLRRDCEIGNGDDNDPTVLEARERFFRSLIRGGKLWGVFDEGYLWGALMLEHFLDGNGAHKDIQFSMDDAFVQDPGVTRATKELRPRLYEDEPTFIQPLLYTFVYNHTMPSVNGFGVSHVRPVVLKGEDYYVPRGMEPRLYSRGFWAAFGHVVIDGTFSGAIQASCSYGGAFFAKYTADYQIDDNYEWFPEMKTPFNFPFASGTVWIPHQWELSLENATPARAAKYSLTISWTESNYIFIPRDFSYFRELELWEWGQIPPSLIVDY